jgi:hypothetical protein
VWICIVGLQSFSYVGSDSSCIARMFGLSRCSYAGSGSACVAMCVCFGNVFVCGF